MLKELYIFLITYFIIINLIAIVITIVDKKNAVNNKWRVSENALLSVSTIGGAIGMYVTMHIIHHKTKKLKFMLGIPLIFFGEILLLIGIYFLFKG